MQFVTGRPGLTRVDNLWIKQRCAGDVSSLIWAQALDKLGALGNSACVALEVPANTAAQPSMYDLLQVAGVRIVKVPGFFALGEETVRSRDFIDLLYLLDAEKQLTLFRARNNRYEGADRNYPAMQGKFVTDHVAKNQGAALAAVNTRMARGQTPAVQTIICADGELTTFCNHFTRLRAAGYYDQLFKWLQKEKGPSLVAKGRQINTVMFESLVLNVWLYRYDGIGAYALLPAAAGPIHQKRIVYGVTMDEGERRLIYHLEDMLDAAGAMRSGNWTEKLIQRDKVLAHLQLSKKTQISGLLDGPPVVQAMMHYQRP